MHMKFSALALFFFLTACGGSAPILFTGYTQAQTPGSQQAQTPGSQAHDPEIAKASDQQLPPAAAGGPADIYLVQAGDLLTIEVWKERDLQREVRVRPDGGINFPLVGDVDVTGKTTEQLQKEIAAKLTKYVPDPVVTIAVKESLGNKIFVVGKVNKPGDYMVNRNTDVMQALSMAGGITPFASENNIKILRREHGVLRSIPFKYSRVEKGKDLEQNIILQGGDVVVVP
jgi:polysaccharide export outer membrane protein